MLLSVSHRMHRPSPQVPDEFNRFAASQQENGLVVFLHVLLELYERRYDCSDPTACRSGTMELAVMPGGVRVARGMGSEGCRSADRKRGKRWLGRQQTGQAGLGRRQ